MLIHKCIYCTYLYTVINESQKPVFVVRIGAYFILPGPGAIVRVAAIA